MKKTNYYGLILSASFAISALLLIHHYLQRDFVTQFSLYQNIVIYFLIMISHLAITGIAIIYLIKYFRSFRSYIPFLLLISSGALTVIWNNEPWSGNPSDITLQKLVDNKSAALAKLSPDYDNVYQALYTDGHRYPIDKKVLQRMLNNGQYNDLESTLTEAHHQTDMDISNEANLKDTYYYAFGNDHDAMLEAKINKWVETTGSYQSYTARAVYLHNKAWTIRGSSYFKDIPTEQAERMTSVFKDSIADSIKALALNEKNPVAYIYLIYCNGVVNDYDSTKIVLKHALKLYPYSYHIREAYLNYHLEPKWGGSYRKMFEFSKNALRYAKNNPRLAGLAAETIHVAGKEIEDTDPDSAIVLYKKALQFAPHNDIYMSLARIYKNQNNVANELEQYNLIINKCPRHAKALIKRGSILVEKGNKTQAIKDAEQAITLDEGVWVTAKAGWIFETAQDYKDALTAYTLAMLDDPHYEYPYSRLIELHIYLNNDYASAFRVAKSMSEYFPDNPDGWLYAADYAYDLHMNEAEMYINKYFEIIEKTGVKNKTMHEAAKRLLIDINNKHNKAYKSI